MELLPILPPYVKRGFNIQVNIGSLPKHIESLLEVTISYSKTNPNIEALPSSSCTALTCLLHNTYIANTNSLLIQETLTNINEGFYIIEMTLVKGNNLRDSLARVYGIWGDISCIVIGLPYSIFKPIEFA